MTAIIRDKIILVDNSWIVASNIVTCFQSEMEHEVIFVDSLKKVASLLEKEKARILFAIAGLVLSDAPNGEIIDLFVTNKIPTVVLTAGLKGTNRKIFMKKGVIDYFEKQSSLNIRALVDLAQRLEKNQLHTLMVVDDSIIARKKIAFDLNMYRFNVIQASNGIEGMHLLRKHPEINLIITDYNMPKMNGLRLIKEVRRKYSRHEIACVGLSSNLSEELASQFIKGGANDFLIKPYIQEEFYCRVMQNIEILEYTAELKRLNDLKNKFLGMAAHDLRSPIHGIGMSAYILLHQKTEPATQEKLISNIQRLSQEMTALIDELLDVSIIESGNLQLNLQEENLSDLLRQRVETLKMIAAKKSIDIIENYQDVTPVYM